MELLIKLDGTLREALGSLPLGTGIEVRGPYGVPYVDRIRTDRAVLLAGGGSGIAPLLCFRDQHPERVAGTVFGFREAAAARLFPAEDLVIEERDGRRADAVAAERRKPGVGLAVCGPQAMLEALAKRYPGDPNVYVSLEARIGCGIGTCLGCSIATTRGMRRICRDGPLFPARELPWQA
jgi:dihydroorotate dehydrogenase electron transfer subunit